MYQDEMKIPRERIAILIGTKGFVKKELERKTNTKLEINKKEDLVIIKSDDSLDIFKAKPIIKSIARGFNPKTAELLLNEEYCLEVIDIKDFAKTKKKFVRLKSRCIGTEGKAKKNIEQLTNTNIVIYGKTISIIGKIDDVMLAKQAIEKLLYGAKHSNVYRSIIKRKETSEA